jgi:hypothetical protein
MIAMRIAGDDTRVPVASGCSGDEAGVEREAAVCIAGGDAFVLAGVAVVAPISTAIVGCSGTVGEHAVKMIAIIAHHNKHRTKASILAAGVGQ